MISIDDNLPDFSLDFVSKSDQGTMTSDYLNGKWTILFFYPEDFSFICPTEVTGYNEYKDELEEGGAQIVGVSVDSVETHAKWIEELGITYPLVSDSNQEFSQSVGVLDKSDNRANRATFIINPELEVEFVMVTSRNVGRSVKETVRIYHAIQSGKKCPADYNPKTMKEEGD